jgi:hypothetical protein
MRHFEGLQEQVEENSRSPNSRSNCGPLISNQQELLIFIAGKKGIAPEGSKSLSPESHTEDFTDLVLRAGNRVHQRVARSNKSRSFPIYNSLWGQKVLEH